MTRIAVWRLGAGFQTDQDSVVGGGMIALQAVRLLVEAGHHVTVVGRVSDKAAAQLAHVGAGVADQVGKVEKILVLTGPFNALYSALYETYRRLAAFEGEVAYAMWDAALPFHFAPERVALFRKMCPVTHQDLTRNKTWTVLTQLSSLTGSGASLGLDVVQPRVRACFWELLAGDAEPLPPCPAPTPRFAYFGSPRPGRLSELKRWFGGETAPPVDLWGKWADRQVQDLRAPNLTHRGACEEALVLGRLNGYRATLHSADTAYVKQDFVAQRFIENAVAGVPVAFSDRLQPSLHAVVDPRWIVRSELELAVWWRRVSDPTYREHLIHDQRARILGWTKAHPAHPSAVLMTL